MVIKGEIKPRLRAVWVVLSEELIAINRTLTDTTLHDYTKKYTGLEQYVVRFGPQVRMVPPPSSLFYN